MYEPHDGFGRYTDPVTTPNASRHLSVVDEVLGTTAGTSAPPVTFGGGAEFIDFRLPDDRRFAIGYSDLVWVGLTKRLWVVLHFGSHTLKLKARNPKPLYHGFIRREITEVVVVRAEEDVESDDLPVVRRIVIRPNRPGDSATMA